MHGGGVENDRGVTRGVPSPQGCGHATDLVRSELQSSLSETEPRPERVVSARVSLIFVSYRRQDTQSATGRLCDKLQTHFSVDQVFHDIESIEAGDSFPATIASKIAASSVVLVMIGRHWLDIAGKDGRSRLF